MKKYGFVLLFISMAFTTPVFGQKQLLIEKSGNPRSERLKLYDELTFQLKNDDAGWYTRQILDMDANGQMLYLGDTWIMVDDIARIRLARQRAIPNIIGGALQGGGASMILGDLWYTLRGDHRYTDGGIEFGFVNIAVGTVLKALLGPIRHRLGENKRLRVIDLTF